MKSIKLIITFGVIVMLFVFNEEIVQFITELTIKELQSVVVVVIGMTIISLLFMFASFIAEVTEGN